jgi:hypothetical protein
MKVVRWWGRVVTSFVAGLMAALMLVLGGGRLARPGNEDSVALILLVFAVPLFIVVSVISYRLLKPRSEDR